LTSSIYLVTAENKDRNLCAVTCSSFLNARSAARHSLPPHPPGTHPAHRLTNSAASQW